MPPPPHSSSSSPSADARSDIVFSDPSVPFVVQPVIQDLLRTHYCIAGSVFLVERIDSVAPIRGGYRAVRLLVSDGVSCVQAMLRSEAHGLVHHGLMFAGCYVRVDSFELRFLDLSHGPNDQTDQTDEFEADGTVSAGGRREREIERPKIVYLVLENPVTVGWNTAYLQILESQNRVPLPVLSEELERVENLDRCVGAAENEKGSLLDGTEKGTLDTASSNREASPDYASIADPRTGGHESVDIPELDTSRTVPTVARLSTKPSRNAAQPSGKQLPWSTDDPTKPARLTPLRMIPHLPYKQNWMVNILAVVSSISDVEPSHLPPYHQRTARLTDPSTPKHVLLTVFLDPDDFTPAVGSVVLILGVKNHRFDGGSLKKYASDRPKNGARWWFQEPDELGWCDVAGLRAWWDSKRASG